MSARIYVIVGLLGALLGGCAIKPPVTPPSAMCNLVRYKLDVEIPGYKPPSEAELERRALGLLAAKGAVRDLSASEVESEGSFGHALRSALFRSHALDRRTQTMLFLSGGSQEGAFGAGYLNGWSLARGGSEENGALPEFAVVTGISTGAILSTWAFINEPYKPARQYRIANERRILRPFVSGDAGPLTVARTLAKRGAVGDLEGLRELLAEHLDDATFQKIHDRHLVERKLYVGAVEIDSGQAVAFDMTELASRYIKSPHDDEKSRLEGCYVEAIIASSAVPMAALPVFIDNRMYIDGGARFGLFSQEVGEVAREGAAIADKSGRAPARYFAIMNRTMTLPRECAKANNTLCEPPHAPTGDAYGAHRPWSLDKLGFRSVAILIDQGYKFAAAYLAHRIPQELFRLATIEPDIASHRYRINHPELGTGEMTCPDWRAYDRDRDHPLEFHARYMHCLVDYGEKRGRTDGWESLR